MISVYGCHEHRHVGTSIPSPGCDGEGRGEGGGGRGNLRCLDPRQVLYKPFLLGAKDKKTKRILMCEVTGFFAYSKRTAFSDLRSLLFFCVKNTVFRVSATPAHGLDILEIKSQSPPPFFVYFLFVCFFPPLFLFSHSQ